MTCTECERKRESLYIKNESIGYGNESIAITLCPETPPKRLQQAIVQAIAPQSSENTKKTVEFLRRGTNGSRQRKLKY